MTGAQYTSIFKKIGAVVTECRLNVSNEGLESRAVDIANVAMIMAKVKSEHFETYDSELDDYFVVGLDLNLLLKVRPLKKDRVEMHLYDNTQPIMIIINNEETYQIKTLDVNTVRKTPNIPELKLPAKFKLSAKAFADTIKKANVFSDKIIIETGVCTSTISAPEVVETKWTRFRKNKDNTGNIVYSRTFDAFDLDSCPENSGRSLFSIDYLRDMAKELSDMGELTINLGIDHPVLIEAEKDGFEIKYLLAPRIEAD